MKVVLNLLFGCDFVIVVGSCLKIVIEFFLLSLSFLLFKLFFFLCCILFEVEGF